MPFVPRYNDNGIRNNPYWYGSNPFYNSGYGMPNCTCYTWGRFWELSGVRPTNLPTGNAQDWWNRMPSNYVKSQVPVLGAIACWYGGGKYYGHVAIVEQIFSNGDIQTSNSGYGSSFFWLERCYKSDGFRSGWESNRGYKFQGFVYPPKYADGSTPVPTPAPTPETRHWQSLTTYGQDYLNPKSINNAYLVADFFLTNGWTLESVCAMLGNMSLESFISPTMYELGVSESSRGYGLVQWTPAVNTIIPFLNQNYPTWESDIDVNGNGQCQRLENEKNNNPTEWYAGWYGDAKYNQIKSLKEFSESTNSDMDIMTGSFMWCYLRPGTGNSLPDRIKYAEYYYNLLQGYEPHGPTGKSRKKMPLWMKLRRFNLY